MVQVTTGDVAVALLIEEVGVTESDGSSHCVSV